MATKAAGVNETRIITDKTITTVRSSKAERVELTAETSQIQSDEAIARRLSEEWNSVKLLTSAQQKECETTVEASHRQILFTDRKRRRSVPKVHEEEEVVKERAMHKKVREPS